MLDVSLSWTEEGSHVDSYNVQLWSHEDHEHKVAIFREIAAFSRGALPVAWFSEAHEEPLFKFLNHSAISDEDLDTTLCFLLRRKSRWLDPGLWSRIRTGTSHEMESIAKAIELPWGDDGSLTVAKLAWLLPARKGFPVSPAWTASELADWQDLQRVF